MKKKTDLFKRVYKSDCTIMDDIVSYHDYTEVHAYDIDMLATGKNKEIVGFFVRKKDEEMIKAFDNVGKLQMKINVLSDVVNKNNDVQKELYNEIKELKKIISEKDLIIEEKQEKIVKILKEIGKEEYIKEFVDSDSLENEELNEEPELVDDDISDLLGKDKN